MVYFCYYAKERDEIIFVRFSLTNYRNFRETAVLNLSEAKITEHPGHLLKNAPDAPGILPMAAIYGLMAADTSRNHETYFKQYPEGRYGGVPW